MFNSILNKFIAAIFVTGVFITLIGFIGNKAISAQELTKDAVVIELADAVADEVKAAPAETKAEATEAVAEESIENLIAGADLEKGAKISKKCLACHSFKKGGAHVMGPALWGIVGHEKAAIEGFPYSDGIKEVGGNWDYVSLNALLISPRDYIKGTKMRFRGLKAIEDRAALIAWMRLQADTPIPLPSE